jgi:hypothetical protein
LEEGEVLVPYPVCQFVARTPAPKQEAVSIERMAEPMRHQPSGAAAGAGKLDSRCHLHFYLRSFKPSAFVRETDSGDTCIE